MTEDDVLYRALNEMNKALSADPASSRFMDLIASANEPEAVTVTHNVCHIDADWIIEIERGLVCVGKAIDENRQFIRSDGEIKPIEKVKHVSKESVQHLSRHSDLITREQKDDIVPDKLYTVEKDSDYAVYENRFLYTLLCRVRDFVNVRYEAIVNAYKQYLGEYEVSKTVKAQSRELRFSFKLSDAQQDVVFASADSECAALIARMDKILQSVSFYLRTPIMQEVMKHDKITGAITKTNILLMNKNFSGALKLYEYLLVYDKDGYTIEKRVDSPDMTFAAREFAIPAMLTAFIMYEHGLGLEKHLQAEFEKEELRRAEERQKELQRKLEALKKKIERSGQSVDEYILMLEERNAIIENSYDLWQDALGEIEELKGQISRLENEIESLERDIENLNAEIERLHDEIRRAEEEHKRQIEELQRKFDEEMNALKEEHRTEIEKLKADHESALAALKAEHTNEVAAIKKKAQEEYEQLKRQSEEQLAKLKDAHKNEMDKLRAEHKSRLDAMQAEHKREAAMLAADCDRRLNEMTAKVNDSASRATAAAGELAEAQRTLRLTSTERDVLAARLTAIRKEQGLLTEEDDFTTEEGFNALEHDFEVLGKLLNDEYKNVKEMLRKEILGGRRTSARKKNKKSKQYIELQEFAEERKVSASADALNVGDDDKDENAEQIGIAKSDDLAGSGEDDIPSDIVDRQSDKY